MHLSIKKTNKNTMKEIVSKDYTKNKDHGSKKFILSNRLL
jgi:hypothetical protein